MRTNIDLDEKLVTEGLALSGIKTKKELLNEALNDFVKHLKRKEMKNLRGKITWEGDLNEMRSYGYE